MAATVTAQADGTATDSTTTLVNAATGQAIAESAVENNYASVIGRASTLICSRACLQALANTIGIGITIELSQSDKEEALKTGIFKNSEEIAKLTPEQRAYLNNEILNNKNSASFLGNEVWIPNASGGFTPVNPDLVVTTYGGKQVIDPRILVTDTGGIQYPSDYEKPNHTGGDQVHVPENTGALPGSEIQIGDWQYTELLKKNENHKVRKVPVFKTDSEAAKKAKELGYEKTNFRTKSGAAIFKKGNSYISRDVDGHIGGAWKEASSPDKLNRKDTRNGTFDIELNRLGD
ncbi:toxin C-terminal domain-containing protein [Pasteurella testudinis]|uniref:toxin C-terminal domain-containing protein n=1 Tax=Pasteurella testudinis TaxID=761 RepID=UPI0040581C7F